MKNLLIALVMVLMASTLFAANTITITASDAGSGVLSVYYNVAADSESDPVGISLNFSCSNGATTTAAAVTNVDPCFPVYIDQAHDTGATYNFDPVQGSPLAMTDAAGVPAGAVSDFALCMGRLGQGAPAKGVAHKLCDIQLTQGTAADTCVTIAADALRGGVVGSTFTVNVPATCVTVTFAVPKCMKETAPEYAVWQAWGEPDCWCYKRQCRGDVNNAKEFNKWVMGADLALFKQAYNKTDAVLHTITNGICADFNHGAEFGKRVMGGDLGIFKTYYNKADASVPECPMTNYNFWK